MKRPATLFEAWAQYVDITDTCWLWRGTITTDGYGHFNFQGHTYIAHRVSIELFTGPIPKGFHGDHLCRVHACVAPYHLEAVPPRVNAWRGNLKNIYGWGQCTHGFTRKKDCYDCREVWRDRYEAKVKGRAA
jgi:hypothetical protein